MEKSKGQVSMKIHTLKNAIICGIIGACVIYGGCGNSVNYDITNDAIAISDKNQSTYVNPEDSTDTYSTVEINGVTYIPYGTQGKTITNKEIGSCIAYSKTDTNDRFYDINGNSDFIARYYVDGEMEQFDFLRSADTLGKEIDIPDFIDDSGYDIWN
jgi:hypothetical protein